MPWCQSMVWWWLATLSPGRESRPSHCNTLGTAASGLTSSLTQQTPPAHQRYFNLSILTLMSSSLEELLKGVAKPEECLFLPVHSLPFSNILTCLFISPSSAVTSCKTLIDDTQHHVCSTIHCFPGVPRCPQPSRRKTAHF